ncbi:hypothetical protein [Aquipuribacter sp. SD81]|uniref:hypothetical protein n=1 Tax=Aquipuribacter sp. SD81 TaxID=3127703 RepID=UPI003017B684
MSGPWDLPGPGWGRPRVGSRLLGRALLEGLVAGLVTGAVSGAVSVAAMLGDGWWFAGDLVDGFLTLGDVLALLWVLGVGGLVGGAFGAVAGVAGGAVAAMVLGAVWSVCGRDWSRVRPALPVALVVGGLGGGSGLLLLGSLPAAAGLAVVAGLGGAWRADRAVRRVRAVGTLA